VKREHIDYLACPQCAGALDLEADAAQTRVREGTLRCQVCAAQYPITNFIPRFSTSTSYADSFGPQWRTFARSQLDTDRTRESAIRFDSEIGWQIEDLRGKSVVEFGSGAGRFVDVVSRRGAGLVIGLDATDAVDAAQESLGDRDNVLFVQGDIFRAPLRAGAFDFGYSIGVLHHTPDPEESFRILTRMLRPGGRVGLSLYEISLYARPNRNSLKVATMDLLWSLNLWRCELFRAVTTRVPQSWFLAYCKSVVPVLHYLNKIPVLRYLRYLLPSTCYRHLPVIWSMVDTHDTYATKIVHQYRGKDVFQWFLREGLGDIILRNSRAGWVSVTGTVGDAQQREAQRLDLRQPTAPGLDGTLG
jgi:SAM-dependent methyltransferase